MKSESLIQSRIQTHLFALLLFCCFTLSISAQNALDFDGNNDIVQTTYSGVLGSADRTFEAWVNVSPSAPASNLAIMDYGLNAAGSRNSFSVSASKGLTFVSGGTNANIGSTSNVIPVGQWTHVAFVLDNGTGYMYVNGTQVGTGNLTNVNTPSGNANLRIGQRVTGGSIPFEGGIDEVRVWDVARTPAELSANMNTELCPHPNLKAYYRFNEGTAGGTNTGITSTTDFSGNSNNGTLSSFSLNGATSNWVTGATLTSTGPSIQVLMQTNVNCFGDSTGSISVSATGGTAPLAYTWSNGNTTSTGTNLPAGTYQITVEDAQQCAADLSVTLSENPAISSTAAPTNIACSGDSAGSAKVTATGGVGSLSYLWFNGDTTDSIGGLIAGMYTVVIADSLGCQVLDTVTIDDLNDSLLVVVDMVVDAVCEGGDDGSITAQVTGGQIPYSYLWNDPNNQVFSQASNLTEGIYLVVVTDGNGCTAEAQAAVGFQNAAPVVDLGADIITSQSSAIVDAPTGFASYDWSTGANTASINVTQSGTYTVTVTDDNGCTGTDEIEVTLDQGTGIAALEDEQAGISLFPNPASTTVTLQFEQPQRQFSLTNLSGQVLLRGNLNGLSQTEISVEELSKGLYFLQLEGEDSVTRFIKLEKL